MALYIGTNYHPHDWEPQRWPIDIDLMKRAGFTTVRLGHLCWDSYEPEEGLYTFEWFDKVMELFANANIGVLLDVSMRPAPKWVHALCAGCDIHGKSGNHLHSLTRYMEDVDDLAYQKYALRFAARLVERYRNHPALFAFGLCNELGTGYISYSEYARRRFVQWLRNKYKTVNHLNTAWATQRWSRKLLSFEEAVLQENEAAIGPPEAWLDMRRFFSDGIGNFAIALKKTVENHAPGIPHSSNHYSDHPNLGFDYLKVYDQFVDYPGIGVYPSHHTDRDDSLKFVLLTYMYRVTETNKPMWCLEFISGSTGIHHGPYGVDRMYAFFFLMHRAQMVLAWTFRTMLSGEEQFWHGLLNHDGIPSQNYNEYTKIASDFHKLEAYGFPYLPKPLIAVAFSYDSSLISNYHKSQFRQPYPIAVVNALMPLERRNLDFNIVDLRALKYDYKLLIVPGQIIMEKISSEAIRNFVDNGGTVIMTGYSATMDETAKAFSCPKPGQLSDVFGIRVAGFNRTDIMEPEVEVVMAKTGNHPHELLRVAADGDVLNIDVDYYEDIELSDAKCFATFVDKKRCAISVNNYGKGRAFYVAVESNAEILGWLIDHIAKQIGIENILVSPEGICVRQIAPNQFFYLNTSRKSIHVPLFENGKGILTQQDYKDEIILSPYDGELVVSVTS